MKPDKQQEAVRALRNLSDPKKAEELRLYFKAVPGGYGEGDQFIGLSVPQIRSIAMRFKDLELKEIQKLIESPIHEERLLALMILTIQYSREDLSLREKIYKFYLKNIKYINNWDLVDGSAPSIVGAHLHAKGTEAARPVFLKLANSKRFWDRRIAIVSTFYFIRNQDFEMILELSKLLLRDSEDLIQKAIGWMLREMGNRDEAALEQFLEEHCVRMPRTMLRYAIEKFPEKKRRGYLLRKS